MRKTSFLFLALLTIQSCNQPTGSYAVKLDLEGVEGKWILLSAQVNRKFVGFDSVQVEPGIPAVLSGSIDGVQTMYLSVKGEEGSLRLLMENAEYTISGTIEKPVIETSSKAQIDLNDYNERIGSFEETLSSILGAYYASLETEDQAATDSILHIYDSINEEKDRIDSAYIAENTSSYVSVLLLRSTFYAYETEDLEAVLNALAPPLHRMEEYQYMYTIMEKQKNVAVGQTYKDFGLETPDGEMLKVSEVHNGNVLLIDFWASWCGPCRRSNPELVELYNKYHAQGLEILGVSLDNDRESWLKAIDDDKLTWYHISDVKGWQCEGSRLYGVPSIPHTVLVDRDGIIRAKKLHGEELKEAILSLL
ncbi:MAG: TlpA disulfide reductase family protein [Bacteroidota bacterium]